MKNANKDNASGKSEFLTPGYCFGRIALFLFSSVGVLLAYLLLTFPLLGILSNLAERAGERGPVEIPENITFAVYTAVYIIPLYLFLFRGNIGLKTRVLHLTEEEFSLKTVFADTYRSVGWIDHVLYALYSMLLFLPFCGGDPFENPLSLVFLQEMVFYTFSLPKIIAWLCAVLTFAVQYALCLVVASKNWDKNRLRRPPSSPA